jgi:hypothetical protein
MLERWQKVASPAWQAIGAHFSVRRLIVMAAAVWVGWMAYQNLLKHLTADQWKVLGLFVGGAGTIISAVAKVIDERGKSEAARQDATAMASGGRESGALPGKRSLYISIAALCIAVLGFAVGFAGETASQQKAVQAASEQADAAKRQAAEIQRTLEGLARVFTRFESISLQLETSLPFDAPELQDFRHRLEMTITSMVDDAVKVGTTRDGVRVITSRSKVPEVFSFDFKYGPGTSGAKTKGEIYLEDSVPYIAIFKKPINPEAYVGSYEPLLRPDLSLIPAPGAGQMYLVKSPDELDESGYLVSGDLRYGRVDLPRSSWSPSGKIMSLKDLEGAQAIICPPWDVWGAAGLQELWDVTRLGRIVLFVNDLRIPIETKQLKVTQTSYGKVYSYVFPKLVEF